MKKNNKENNKTKNKSNKTAKKTNSKKKKVIKIIIITLLVIFIILAGILAGVIFGLFGGKYALTKEELIIDYSNSVVLDQENNVIATLSAKENRKIISKDEMGEYLPKAFVAIEDKRFYSHHGVDISRTGAAIVSYLFHKGEGSSVGGGSTITQQLVKNITNEKDDSGVQGAIRKIKEMSRAYQIEKILSKDQILELYMNIIYLGGNVNGVGMASEYYFRKEPTELSLAESAFIAGVTHSPNIYNPFVDEPKTERIVKRTKTVLKQMNEQEKISKEEYDKAVEEVDNGLNFKKGTIIDKAGYSSHTEALIRQLINQLVEEKGMDEEYAETYLYSNGFKIYSTEIPSVQEALEDEYSKSKYQVKTTVEKKIDGKMQKVKEAAQSATVVIDQSNGYVVGAIGVLGEKEAGKLNRVTQAVRQPGSSIKPIGVYGPALEEGVITAASVYDDAPVKFGNYSPGNAYSGFKGLMNMRQAIKVSSNTVAVQVLSDLSAKKAIEYLEKLGITSLNKEKDDNLSLALGGITSGITPLQMGAAYATIANDGEYITPTFYTKVTDSQDKVILEPKQEKNRVFSEENSYILKQLLTEPLNAGGTATNCKIPKMETSAKTGTTNSKKDKWLCGFTPYYTAATWYGYDTPTAIPGRATSNASNIWKNVMTEIHKDLKGKNFEKPSGIVSENVCKDSGQIATSLCKNDPRGNRSFTEIFAKGTAPKKTCTCHVEAEICKETEKLATDNCKNKEKRVFITRQTDNIKSGKTVDSKYVLPEEKCDKCQKTTTPETPTSDLPIITLNGESSITLKVGETYNELGAKATDTTDGDISKKIQITGKVDTNTAGTYKLTYSITNSKGKKATITRTVVVQPNEEKPQPTPTPSEGE